MSSRLSDQIQTFGDPCCRTVIRASLNAKASAIRGEATNSDRACPSVQRSLCLSSTIHSRPEVKVSILQDASQLIMAHSSGAVGYIIGCTAIGLFPTVTWAISYSRAPIKAFVRIVVEGTGLASKTSRFLAYHRFHRIHGRTGEVIPLGGRHVRWGGLIRAWTGVVRLLQSGATWRGAKPHTCWAKGHEKNRCKAVSGALQCEHCPPHAIPLFWRFTPRGSAPQLSFHKNSFNFSDVFTVHICCFQLNPTGVGALFVVVSFSP